MAYETNVVPYELLVRWDVNGTLQGAHFQNRVVTKDDSGKVVSEGVTDPEPIDPQSEFVQQLMTSEQAAALTALAGVEAMKTALAAERNQEAAAAEAALQEQADAHSTAMAQLEAQCAANAQETAAALQAFEIKEAAYLSRIADLEAQLATATAPIET